MLSKEDQRLIKMLRAEKDTVLKDWSLNFGEKLVSCFCN